MARPHLLLINLGTPTAPEPDAVRSFLLEFLSDPEVVDLPRVLWQPLLRRVVLRRRPARVAELYRSIWAPGGSPLRVETERMVDGLRVLAKGAFTVSAAYRYGAPSIGDELARAARETDGPIIPVPLFPQRTGSTTGTAFACVAEEAQLRRLQHRVRSRCILPDAPGYIAALAARWREALTDATETPDHLVISFHGIPVRYDRREHSQYRHDCEATTRAFLSSIRWPADRATLAFQSKFGFEKWLSPATADVLATLPTQGVKRVAVITPGFLTEGLETLEEIGIQGKESFLHAGGRSYLRIGAVEAHPAMLDALRLVATDHDRPRGCAMATCGRGIQCCTMPTP